ncbi:MAG: selenocysteine-specific translation elongation factor [Candidatus Aegiribacteria sp.]|nr:selenocysteine-specific translation elongation factor [Candidatus Aegiribacteria sp.]
MGVIVGTAGHIDHGKSSLVKYLTGTDPDRLKEEKERGITIELGYVFMPMPDGDVLSFIDVPGHEKFIRQMVAGVATVDCFLLVVAADEGVMPQTAEHLDILRLLGVNKGIVALTKCDLVSPEMQDLAEADIVDFLQNTPFEGTGVIRVSSETGKGMEDIREALIQMKEEIGQRQTGTKFRLDIDRVFILEGFGTIIGGTAVSGSVKIGDKLELQPGGNTYRVRELRVNANKEVQSGSAGDRIALNLVGLQREDVSYGSCVAEPGFLQVKNSLDTRLTLLKSAKPLKRYQRVRLHTGTAEIMARAVPVETDVVHPGSTGFVHFQLESQVVALPGDRFVIRNYSPVITIGGGIILEAGTGKVRKKHIRERISHLEVLASGDIYAVLSEMVQQTGFDGVSISEAAGATGNTPEVIQVVFAELQEQGTAELMKDGTTQRAVNSQLADEAEKKVLSSIQEHHETCPVSPGVHLSAPGRILSGYPQWFVRSVVENLTESGRIERRSEWFALSTQAEGIPSEYAALVEQIIRKVDSGGIQGFSITDSGDDGLVNSLIEREIFFELTKGILISAKQAESVKEKVIEAFGETGFTLAELRDFLGVSRKLALQWGEFFDRKGWTVRKSDRRIFTS